MRALAVAILLTASPAVAQSTQPLADHGCTGCHSLDGSPGAGPSLLASRNRDDVFLARAIRDPDADLSPGFARGFMPRLSLDDAEVESLIDAIHAIDPDARPAPPSPLLLLPLALSMLVFVLGHFVLSSRGVRARLIARLGEGRFVGVYSAIVGLALAGVIGGWLVAPFVPLWAPSTWTRWIPNVLVPIAIVSMVLGFTSPSPTAAGQGVLAAQGARGIVRITRHPALWGFALWGLSHLAPNGDVRSTIVFVGIATLAIGGMLHIDARRAAAGGADWERFRAETSVIPFAAILAGRQKLVLRELVTWRPLLALAIYAAVLHLHRWIFGVSPLP